MVWLIYSVMFATTGWIIYKICIKKVEKEYDEILKNNFDKTTILCNNCHKQSKYIDGKCEFCGMELKAKYEKVIENYSFYTCCFAFIGLIINIPSLSWIFLLVSLYFLYKWVVLIKRRKIEVEISKNNTALRDKQKELEKEKEEKIAEEKKQKEEENKILQKNILEQKHKVYEKEKEKIIEKYTKKILDNPEILCLYSKILDKRHEINVSLKNYSKNAVKTLLWDFVLGDIKIKKEGIKIHGIFDIYKSKCVLNNKDKNENKLIDGLDTDELKIEIKTKYDNYYIQLNEYLTTNNVIKLAAGDKSYKLSGKCKPIFGYTCLLIDMIKACDNLTEFENNKELFTIYNNMYEAKMTDESIVNKMYTLYTNLYIKSFKDKLEETDWWTIIELAKRKKLAEKYNIDSDAVIETKEQLIDYIVANLIDFNREGQIIGIANILKKQEKMKTSLKFDIMTNIDEILMEASEKIAIIEEQKYIEDLKEERDRLLKGDLSKEKNREELELSLDNIKTGYDFENYVANLYKRLGYTIEKVTKKSGDQGADVIATKDNYKYVIQAKYYSSHVGNAAVQEIVAAIAMYKANKGIVITNNAFTQSAKELAKANNIELVDGKKIEEYKKQILGRYQIKVKI